MVCTLYVTYVRVRNSQESVISYELPTGKLVSVMEHIDVRECIACTLYVMHVGVGNSQESVIP